MASALDIQYGESTGSGGTILVKIRDLSCDFSTKCGTFSQVDHIKRQAYDKMHVKLPMSSQLLLKADDKQTFCVLGDKSHADLIVWAGWDLSRNQAFGQQSSVLASCCPLYVRIIFDALLRRYIRKGA